MSRHRRTPLLFSNRSDPGRVRQENEDYLGYFRDGERHLFVVADGMGGEKGGRQASLSAVSAVQQRFEGEAGRQPADILAEATAAANLACLEIREHNPDLDGLGTTLDLILVEGDRAWWSHVGDGRIYLIRSGQAHQVTNDHTTVQKLVDAGLISNEEAAEHPRRHVLSRAVGRDPDLVPDLGDEPLRLREGDALLMCTDGLSDMVDDHEMARLVTRYGPQRASEKLVALANQRGGHDNITVQVVYRGKPRLRWATTSACSAGDRPRRRRWRMWLLAAVLVMALAAVAAWYLTEMRSQRTNDLDLPGAASQPTPAPTPTPQHTPAPAGADQESLSPLGERDGKVKNGMRRPTPRAQYHLACRTKRALKLRGGWP